MMKTQLQFLILCFGFLLYVNAAALNGNEAKTQDSEVYSIEQRNKRQSESSTTTTTQGPEQFTCTNNIIVHGTKGDPGKDGERGEKGEPGPAGPPGPVTQSGGQVYIRWGQTVCPSTNGTQLVYAGRMGGTFFSHSGGGSNYLCMPDDPQYYSDSASNTYSHLYGTEYEFWGGTRGHLANENAVCVVCEVSTRSKYLMIPAKYSCPSSWTREYYGYLMAERNNNDRFRTEYICVDRNPATAPGGNGHQNSAHLYPTRTFCDTLPCPPYKTDKDVTCVVCTKC